MQSIDKVQLSLYLIPGFILTKPVNISHFGRESDDNEKVLARKVACLFSVRPSTENHPSGIILASLAILMVHSNILLETYGP